MATALVTGTNRGIGLEIARQLHARGDEVIGVCRHRSAELDALGITVIDGIDVSRPEDCQRLAGHIAGKPLDWVLNVAGVMTVQRLGQLDGEAVEAIHRQFDVNALGPLLVTQALMDNLPRGGKIGIVTSRMGSIADNTSGNSYGYRMSKAAVNMAGVSLAHDLKDREIAVALLHPGYVRTAMTEHRGYIDPPESARGLIARMDELTLETSGGFWHTNGERLPW